MTSGSGTETNDPAEKTRLYKGGGGYHLARVAVDPAGGRKTGVGTVKPDQFWIMPDTGFSLKTRICNKQRRSGMLNYVIKRLLGLIPTVYRLGAGCFYLCICPAIRRD